jgi:hypothetical protein
MTDNPKFTPRTKHIAIKYHHFWKHVKTQSNPDGFIEIVYCSTEEQLADIFMKPTFRLGGQIKFSIFYIHMLINNTFYVGITQKITKLRPKHPPLEACTSNATPSPTPTPTAPIIGSNNYIHNRKSYPPRPPHRQDHQPS